ncbi:MAG TPA: TlpA disulfide reductase family protein [Planctomycetota bacterium]|nr:TlpA disulfide reductase family protein [Planctomycetota bacterium]
MLAALLSLALSAQVGDAAPPITPAAWLGDAPDLKGKVVLVEFWGTWCAPCVATMPHVQELWTRYREQGLVVAAISCEDAAKLKPYVEQQSWTMPVGADTEKALVKAWGVESWPTTFVVGRDGKIVYRGWPLGAEPFVQQALGMETSAATLLTKYVDGSGEPKATLESLVRNATHGFGLDAWARGQGGAPSPRPPKDAGEALSNAASTWGTPVAAGALGDLAAVDQPFDLKAWAQRELGTRFPIGDDELKKLLDDERYADVLAAIVTRHPSDKALAKAKGEDGLRDWCHERVAQYTENAGFVVLIGHWAFGEYKRPAEIHFPPGTAWLGGADGKGFEGVHLNTGEVLEKPEFPGCIEPFLATVVAVQSLAKRKLPGDLGKAAAKLHDELLGDLRKKYGSEKAD